MPQTEQAGEAIDQVQRQSQNDVDGAELEDLHGERIKVAFEHEQQYQQHAHGGEREQIVAAGKAAGGGSGMGGHHTFSPCLLPSRPVGLTSSTTMSRMKAKASL